eukprot:scaffold22790_cov42-Cyclotella_meneghiniana.AAC.4
MSKARDIVDDALTTAMHAMSKARDIVDDALTTAMHAMQTTVATMLDSAPGLFAVARDMFLNVPLIVADWKTIARKREQH